MTPRVILICLLLSGLWIYGGVCLVIKGHALKTGFVQVTAVVKGTDIVHFQKYGPRPQTFYVSYEYAGKTHESDYMKGDHGVGDQVPIFLSTSHPEIISLNPQQDMKDLAGGIVFLALGSLILLFLLWRAAKWWQRPPFDDADPLA